VNEALPAGVVHVFHVPTEDLSATILSTYEPLLSADERARWQRFIPADAKLQFLVGRALLRTSLSRFDPTPPAAWAFRSNAWGRPEIDAGAAPHRLCFNLSHTTGLVACAITAERAVGIDAEDTLRGGALLDIADRYFAPGEVAALRALPREQQRDRFFDYWTLKESYIKARGVGLSLSLQGFSFDLDDPAHARFRADPDIDAAPGRWQFAQWRPTARHRLALCFERRAGESVDVRVERVIPAV
jgi:4'-phosphopantetheinyl transferase